RLRRRLLLGRGLHDLAEGSSRCAGGLPELLSSPMLRTMPRRIAAAERTAEIAEAALRVLERDGLAGLSVRGVATEAGVAVASLRRAFPSQHALREYCLELIEARATARIAALELTGRPLAEELLAQLL